MAVRGLDFKRLCILELECFACASVDLVLFVSRIRELLSQVKENRLFAKKKWNHVNFIRSSSETDSFGDVYDSMRVVH